MTYKNCTIRRDTIEVHGVRISGYIVTFPDGHATICQDEEIAKRLIDGRTACA